MGTVIPFVPKPSPPVDIRVRLQKRRPAQRGRPTRDGGHATVEWGHVDLGEMRYAKVSVPALHCWTANTLRQCLEQLRTLLPIDARQAAIPAIGVTDRGVTVSLTTPEWRIETGGLRRTGFTTPMLRTLCRLAQRGALPLIRPHSTDDIQVSI